MTEIILAPPIYVVRHHIQILCETADCKKEHLRNGICALNYLETCHVCVFLNLPPYPPPEKRFRKKTHVTGAEV